jgi:hypothetical protein
LWYKCHPKQSVAVAWSRALNGVVRKRIRRGGERLVEEEQQQMEEEEEEEEEEE